MQKPVIILGCSSCRYYQKAIDTISASPHHYIYANYSDTNMGDYKTSLSKIQKKADRWDYLSDSVKRKFRSRSSSPAIFSPHEDFVGGYDDFVILLNRRE